MVYLLVGSVKVFIEILLPMSIHLCDIPEHSQIEENFGR